MPKSRVTAKFQVTIPKEVREKTGVRPGELVTIEAVSDSEITLKRFVPMKDPVEVLIGKGLLRRAIPIEELEGKLEAR